MPNKPFFAEENTLVKFCANHIVKLRYTSIVTLLSNQTTHPTNGRKMKPKIVKNSSVHEYLTPEHCYVAENYTCPDVSIARATVKPGVTTLSHHLKGVQEIYLITSGQGKVTVGNLEPTDVAVGDVVVIPPQTSQKIVNTGKTDLVFYCICSPRFTEQCYVNEEPRKA